LRHATSKITEEKDLDAIRTMGFRGEALASISTVARVRLRTRRPGELTGTSVTIEGGSAPAITDDGCPEGTSVEARDLFYNTPARQKFMKSAASEFGRVADVFKRIAIINPGVRFRLVHGSSRPAVDTAGGTLRARLSDIFGADVAAGLMELKAPNVTGFIGAPGAYASRKSLYIYVNGRPVQDKGINRAIIDGYGTVIDGPRFPLVVLDLAVAPEDVDINIHPAKSEVRFRNPGLVYDTVKTAIRLALAGGLTPGREASLPGRKDGAAGFTPYRAPEAGTPAFLQESTPALSPVPPDEARLGFHADGNEVKNPEFLDLITVGQLWGEYLIAESRANGGEFYLVDAHGAAERAAFEGLKRRYFNGGEIKRQMLLLPERVETTPEQGDGITGALEYLARLGFEIIPFGPSARAGGETFMIKATPDILGSRSSADLIKELAEDLSDVGGSSAVEERIEAALMRIACHSVIRGARRLTAEEGNALLRKLADIDFAGHCPHGRPVVKRFSRREVEAMFGK
jgi:DNA mismatch repair protein MutL